MEPLPPLIRLTLRPGTVYYFVHRDLTSPEPHYFIVLNTQPLTDSFLILTVGSSQLGTVRRRRSAMPAETLVEVSPSEYADFRVPTIVDCNQVFELPREELVEKIESRQIRSHRDLPAEILTRIRNGVMVSPRVDESHKNLLRSSPPQTPPVDGGLENP